jgi:hypothetical protein
MAKDTNRLELTKQVQDKKFRGVNLKTGERGLRELAEKRSDDTYGTPLSKGAISAGRQKLKDAGFALQGSSKAVKADKEAAQAAREAGAEERREARGMKKGGWIKDAIKKPGALRQSLGVKKGEKIPAKKLAAAAKAPGKLGQRARLAQTLKKMK